MNEQKFPLSDEVLLVEDSRIAQSMMKKTIFAMTDIKLSQANNGAQGFKIVQEKPYLFKVVLLDLSMPVMHGIDFMYELRKLESNKANTVVIAVTGNQSNLSDIELRNIGLNGAMIKPIDPSKLFYLLNEIPKNPPTHWYGVINN